MNTLSPRFNEFGGTYVPEILFPAVKALAEAFEQARNDPSFMAAWHADLKEWAGRPTALTECSRLATNGHRLFLKREDLLHGGAHKTNQVLAQAQLAKRLGKTRLIAETGAGQHGVATAMVGARLGMKTCVYMGGHDIERQQTNVDRMKYFGAEVVRVGGSEGSLRAAINEALRDWASSYSDTHYLLGTAAGPHPYPQMVKTFQRVIGDEAREQCLERLGHLPDVAVACVGGGSNAIGLFTAFLDDPVELVGVEAGGVSDDPGQHGATLNFGRVGVLHGSKTLVLQDEDGQVRDTHSVSAGLDYPGVGPEHAYLKSTGRAHYPKVRDIQAVEATRRLAREEGILPALESAHALAWVLDEMQSNTAERKIYLVNLSGRGDKDLATVNQFMGAQDATI